MTALKLLRVKATDIALNAPIPYSIYDTQGKLLLRAGTAITIPRYLSMLLARGAYFDRIEIQQARQATAPKKPEHGQSVFEQVESLLLQLKHVYATFAQQPERINLPKRIELLAQQLQQACDRDGDAALAALHLDHAAPYRVHHQMMCALLVELTMRAMSLSGVERLPLLCAALTHDIGLIEAADELENSRQPLSPTQRAMVHTHPVRATEILVREGVDDALWLDAVRNHHERLDGSGYPLARTACDIGLGGRMLAIADVYGALIRSRPYRGNAYFPQNALRDIFRAADGFDGALTQLTIKSIGMMPPGSIVRLRNNEIGVVRSRGAELNAVRVFCVYNPAGMPMLNPIERDICNPAYSVAGKVNYDECRSAEIIMRRLWTA